MNEEKIVDFHKYCETCEYCDVNEVADPCNDCLDNPVNLHTDRPTCYKEDEKKIKTAKWLIHEPGGVICSNCDLFFDDYWINPPNRCERCNSKMVMSDEFYEENKEEK